jgi:hypothetical protein
MAQNVTMEMITTQKAIEENLQGPDEIGYLHSNHNDSGYHSWSRDNLNSSHFDDAYQPEDYDFETNPSFEAGSLLQSPLPSPFTSQATNPTSYRDSTNRSFEIDGDCFGLERNPQFRSRELMGQLGSSQVSKSENQT